MVITHDIGKKPIEGIYNEFVDALVLLCEGEKDKLISDYGLDRHDNYIIGKFKERMSTFNVIKINLVKKRWFGGKSIKIIELHANFSGKWMEVKVSSEIIYNTILAIEKKFLGAYEHALKIKVVKDFHKSRL